MIAQFTLLPVGTKSDSLSTILAQALKPVIESNLNYKITPMATIVEGEWEEIMSLIDRCRKILSKKCDRVSLSISIDDRKRAKNPMNAKIQSLEKKMGKKLNK